MVSQYKSHANKEGRMVSGPLYTLAFFFLFLTFLTFRLL